MANKKRIAKPPILYITQPNLPPAEVSMQTSFHNKNPKNTHREAELRLRNQMMLKEQETSVKEEVAESKPEEIDEITDTKQEDSPPQNDRRDRRQRFRDMSIEEKINYFVQLPSQLPKMKCEVTTAEETFKGYVQKYEDGIVHMKTFQKPFQKEVPFTNIDSIRLLGF
ncbi:CotO family spore coat protein [Halobacillus seohaensis]|uniref:CotO family spore coat protein n=1 Tax=Halobacillus seohaensis TaxID=447421 RepID=A0ABW2EPM4_9BACI